MTRPEIEALLDAGRLEVEMANGRWWRVRRNGKTQLWKTRLSWDAAWQERRMLFQAWRDRAAGYPNDGWLAAVVDVNWEDSELVCDHTGKLIESAYA